MCSGVTINCRPRNESLKKVLAQELIFLGKILEYDLYATDVASFVVEFPSTANCRDQNS